MDMVEEQGIDLDVMRIRSLPFNDDVKRFFDEHEQVFVIEQNRDAQFRSLLVNEMDISPSKLIPVLNYDGMPITADAILNEITHHLPKAKTVESTDYKLHVE